MIQRRFFDKGYLGQESNRYLHQQTISCAFFDVRWRNGVLWSKSLQPKT
jgi:hypothetical protein